jgi:hypothetical protein
LSLWKGRKTKRPRNRRAPVLRLMVRAVSAAQVVLAADLAMAVWLPNELRLMLKQSTLLPALRPAKLACATPEAFTAFLLTHRLGTPAATREVAAQAAIFEAKTAPKKPPKMESRRLELEI